MKKMKYVLMTASVMLVGAASADLLGAWIDGSVDYAGPQAPSVAPAVSGVTASSMTQSGLGAWDVRDVGFGNAVLPSGPTYDPGSSSWWFLIRATGIDNTHNNDEYLAFDLTADAGKQLDMDTLSFDATIVRNAAGDITTTFGIYISTDGGANYTLLDSSESMSHIVGTDPLATALAPETFSYDISSYTGVEDFRVHIDVADNSSSDKKGTYVQGIQLNGSVIPEPATIGLLGMSAAGLILIRRIMM
ncbi:hypothetical protein PDESU_04297 [Pontiella desulfatans]|uniref:Ice-binding protein C-terminal domain-containing protein n=2 Tax=Pontiella desulfatans TaxID=2750659 RepID=A0A6C2U6L1_PONDE|nr:hypothetical protein PDESU_04297 [Pontiella desulfatans]